jgi:rhamnosyltransferase
MSYKQKDIAGTVIFYNPDENVFDNIKSYLTDIEKLYIIDNSEVPDPSLANKLESISIKIIYYAFNENKGIAAALNKGIDLAVKDGYSLLLTMDQDSSFSDQNFSKFKDFALKNISSSTGLISPLHSTKRQNDGAGIGDISEKTTVMTSGNILNIKACLNIGKFEEMLFIDRVDHDFCLRLKEKGYTVLQHNQFQLKHELGAINQRKILNKTYSVENHNPIRKYYMVRNALYIIKKYSSAFPEHCEWQRNSIKKIIKHTLLFEDQKIKKMVMIFRAYKSYKSGNYGKFSK